MTTEITARDKVLLYIVGVFAFLFFFVEFLLMPGLDARDQAAADLAEAQQAQIAMQSVIAQAGTNAAAKTNNWNALQAANASYYGLMSSSDLDRLVSNLELSHNLTPVSLSIGSLGQQQNLAAYVASDLANGDGATAAPSDVDTSDPTLASSSTNSILMELVAQAPGRSLVTANADYYQSVNVDFVCTGTDSDFYTMLDDLAGQYPSVQLESVDIDHSGYVNNAGDNPGATRYTVKLNVILCDKESVVS